MLKNILSFDLEIVPNGEIYHIGAVLNGKNFQRKDIKQLKTMVGDFLKFAEGADYILGHNIAKHDLPVLKSDLFQLGSLQPDFLRLPVIDTLFLSPLAFPENPYHKLVKDYKLIKTGKNDPLADSKLALSIFEDQKAAFGLLNDNAPDLVSFFAFAFALENKSCVYETGGSELCGADEIDVSLLCASQTVFNDNKRFSLKGISDLFSSLSGKIPDSDEAKDIFKSISKGKICEKSFNEIWEKCSGNAGVRPMLAYALSWIRVSGGNSIIPPWVKHEFSEISQIIKKLRYSCTDENCRFCRQHNDSEKLLKKYFGFEKYRTLPDGRPLQKEIIDSNLAGKSLLGILPTGGGKSICYQIPALHRHERLGELTVVISPLKALMKDQVDNLNRATGSDIAAAINGSLTLPERGAVMEKVRLGDIGLLYISPEQLRNYSIAELIKSRDVGCWIFDEAHCLSKWGHDFRPDYLNVSSFIADYTKECGYCIECGSGAEGSNSGCGSGTGGITPLVGAFTATAKKDVVEEITNHFKEKLAIDLECFIGGVQRDNLSFQVWPVTKNEKFDIITNCLKETLTEHKGGAIVYCSSRKKTEDLSGFLNEKGVFSEAFHAGRTEPDKRNIQDDFVRGKISVICATNAFGMGIDKKDIRVVIHADIPGSLENYLQEAGRAGRDSKPSECILLYEQADIENQFSLNAYSRLSFKDIKKILKILKKRGAKTPEIIITPGEIMRLIGYRGSDYNNSDSSSGGRNDDSKARTGVAWLERKGFVERSFNHTLFFKGTPMVKDMDEAVKKIEKLRLSKTMAAVFLTIIGFLFNAEKNHVISADDICTALGRIENLPEKYYDSRKIMGLLSDMSEAGLIREGLVMTAFVKPKGRGSSLKILGYMSDIEKQMLDIMEEMAPDSWLEPDRPDIFNVRLMSQILKDRGFDNVNSGINVNSDTVEKILKAIACDRGKGSGKSIKVSGRKGMDNLKVYVKFSWQEIRRRIELRHRSSRVILDAIISRLPQNLRNGQAQVLSQFFISDIINAFGMDIFFSGFKGDIRQLIETSLLYMHDCKIITLQNGLGVFRQAMTISLVPESRKRQYTKGDYEPLSHHYAQKNIQVHVMEKFAELGLTKIKTALKFVSDYFSSSCDAFINRYFPGQKAIIQTAMTEETYKKIVQSLENNIQEAVVASSPEKNILVLAGPGSGKTKIIVHRCAWLIKAKSVDPSSILILCFNHQTMLELRKRIKILAGNSANSVTAMTYHGFAMRLAGRSFMDRPFPDRSSSVPDSAFFQSKASVTGSVNVTGKIFENFDNVIDEALDILRGDRRLAGIEPNEAREYFLAPYRYILVDEYQDIDEKQYRFISALTGRLENDRESKISIMAVGDDDQSIYGFRNASTKFIEKFKNDYNAKTFYLIENYRSSYPIIQACSSFIALNENRMKKGRPCIINKKRKFFWKKISDIPVKDLVTIVNTDNIASQAVFAAETIKQIIFDNPKVQFSDFAVISRHGISYPFLVAMRMALARENIGFCYSMKSNSGFPMLKIREIRNFMDYLDEFKDKSLRPCDLKKEILGMLGKQNTYVTQIEQMLESWCIVNSDIKISLALAKAFFLETLLEERREHRVGTGVFLSTVHSVKGMEFPFVFILDGGWEQGSKQLLCKNFQRPLRENPDPPHGRGRSYETTIDFFAGKSSDICCEAVGELPGRPHGHYTEEERRLFYVGMTRAKEKLFLFNIKNFFNPHIKDLKGNDFIHEITAARGHIPQFSNKLTVSVIGMADLYIDFPGLFPKEHEIHKNISGLKTGTKVNLKEIKGRIYIVNQEDGILALLSKKGIAEWRDRVPFILNARVLGIVQRRYEKQKYGTQDAKYLEKIKTELWELPIVEVLFLTNGHETDLMALKRPHNKK